MSDHDKQNRPAGVPADNQAADKQAAEPGERLGREPLLSIHHADGKTYITGEIDLEELAEEVDGLLAESFDKLRETAEYDAQLALLDIINQCHARKAELKLNDARLAKLMDVSPSYMSRVLNATPNMTIVSLSKLARALGGKIRISLVIGKDGTPDAGGGTAD